jgi:hypothetical protein
MPRMARGYEDADKDATARLQPRGGGRARKAYWVIAVAAAMSASLRTVSTAILLDRA